MEMNPVGTEPFRQSQPLEEAKNVINTSQTKSVNPVAPEEEEIKKPLTSGRQDKQDLEAFNEAQRKILDDESKDSVRVAVIGNVDSGKSTLVGVLSKIILDDGRGLARSKVFNYIHEQKTGRTSSISHEIIGFKKTGEQIEPPNTKNKNDLWGHIVEKSDKVMTLLDLCGHEKYLKTTVFGLTSHFPDYAMIIVGANMGVQRMTKEHLGIAIALKIPLYVILTKIDIAPEKVYKETLETINKLIRQSGGNQRKPMIITPDDNLDQVADLIKGDAIAPIFPVSNVTGEGVEIARKFVSKLQSRSTRDEGVFEPVEMFIESFFNVKGAGLIASGFLKSGKVTVGQNLLLGPFKNEDFKLITIRSIHLNRVNSKEAKCGQSVCFAIKPANKKEEIKKDMLKKKGLVLVERENRRCAFEFDCEAVILHHATTIQEKYQAIVHVGCIRQAAQVLDLNGKDCLRTKDKGMIRFKFLYKPEYIKKGNIVLFREGRTRGIGVISTVYYTERSIKESQVVTPQQLPAPTEQ